MANKKPEKQQMRFNDAELSLIKSTFAENDDLLRAIRKVFLQMPLDVIDRSNLDSAFKDNRDAQKVLRKTYLPTLDPEAPINQLVDLWMTVDIKDKSTSDVWIQLQARQKLIQYLDEQLQRIETQSYDVSGMTFTDFLPTDQKTPAEAMEDIIARNTVISHNEWQIKQLEVLGGFKDETVEQTQERLAKDSNK